MRSQITLDSEDKLVAWMGSMGEGEQRVYPDLFQASSSRQHEPELWFRLNVLQAQSLLDDLRNALSEVGGS